LHQQKEFTMTLINTGIFWEKKLRIAVLTLATFAALC
jgi:hypothetical protein